MFFELDDTKRRHSMYYDVYNINGWVDPPEGNFRWNFFRGALAGVIGCTLQAVYCSYRENYLKI